MRMQTFKEQVKKSYNRNRNLCGRINIMTKDDLNGLVGGLCMLRAKGSEIYKIYGLDNLCFIESIEYVRDNNTTRITGYIYVRHIFPDNKGIRINTKCSMEQITILDSSILDENSWFIGSMNNRLHNHNHLTKYNYVKEIYSYIGDFVCFCLHSPNQLYINIHDRDIEELKAKDIMLSSVRNKIIITNSANHNEISNYRIVNLSKDLGEISSFLYKNT